MQSEYWLDSLLKSHRYMYWQKISLNNYLWLQCQWSYEFTFATSSLAFSTSPSEEKRLIIIGGNSECSWDANKTGAVASPSLRSAAVGLPSTWSHDVKSNKSSTNCSRIDNNACSWMNKKFNYKPQLHTKIWLKYVIFHSKYLLIIQHFIIWQHGRLDIGIIEQDCN